MLDPLDVLVEDGGDPLPLPAELRRLYGGDLSIPPQRLYANFVASIDGVVALRGVESPGSVLSDRSPADRFVMGLLRATADAVLVGAGTMRDTPGHHWTADHLVPDLHGQWAELRATMGLPAQPRLVLVTGSGNLDVHHPAIRGGATLLTTPAGAKVLAPIVPAGCVVQEFEGDQVPMTAAVAWLREQGCQRILSEAGPRLTGQLLSDHLLDDLFLTLSPVLAGRAGKGRPGLVEGVEFLPGARVGASLASARLGDNFLLLRYALG